MTPLSLPKCGCSERSRGDRVFTCPECVGAALRWWDGERVDQTELFDDIDTTGSVSALDEDEDGLVHISKVLEALGDQGLPF